MLTPILPLSVFLLEPWIPMKIGVNYTEDTYQHFVLPTSITFEISFCFRTKKDDTLVNNRPACCDVDSRKGLKSDGLSEAGAFLDWDAGGYPCFDLF
jgi:hypothetical protein